MVHILLYVLKRLKMNGNATQIHNRMYHFVSLKLNHALIFMSADLETLYTYLAPCVGTASMFYISRVLWTAALKFQSYFKGHCFGNNNHDVP